MEKTSDSSSQTRKFFTFAGSDGDAEAAVSRFRGALGVEEVHLVVRPLGYGPFEHQLESVRRAYQRALESLGLETQAAIWRRFFCSDLRNQVAALEAAAFSNPRRPETPCGISWVTQPPAGEAKVSLWAYHVHDPAASPEKTLADGTLSLRRGELTHLWTTGLSATEFATSYEQTQRIFEHYDELLRSRGLRLADHVLRTWLFVQQIDFHYAGLVKARREFFAKHGLTAETHYIASTGIEGGGVDPAAHVLMDAYAIAGVRPEQIEFLCVPDYMCPTSRYGVTFERGTCVSYRDRRHLLISGTASIDNKGQILHEGDIRRQFDRTFENIAALLAQKGAAFDDFGVLLVYVRDPADVGIVQAMLGQRFGAIPTQVVTAPVCRPGWLIEAEGIAAVAADEPELPAF